MKHVLLALTLVLITTASSAQGIPVIVTDPNGACLPTDSPYATCRVADGTWATTLQPRDGDGDGTTDAYYDTTLNITWLADTHKIRGTAFDAGNVNQEYDGNNDGLVPWAPAVAWAADLTLFGKTDWRLPRLFGAPPTDMTVCIEGPSDYVGGYCLYPDPGTSELAWLYYVTLGNKTYRNSPEHWGFRNAGPFTMLRELPLVWFENDYTNDFINGVDYSMAWSFWLKVGRQSPDNSDTSVAWAVHDGDVLAAPAAAVPEPSTWMLLLLGVGIFVISVRTKQRSRQLTRA